MIIKTLPERPWLRVRKPTVKTFTKNFKSMCREMKTGDGSNITTSGIINKVTDVDLPLDEPVQGKRGDDKQHQRKRQNAETDENDFFRAGEEAHQFESVGGVKQLQSVSFTTEGDSSKVTPKILFMV